jgi:potassium voltage-gated channel Eag-related subfamily H protein 7
MILTLVLYSSVSVPVRLAFGIEDDSGFMLGFAFFLEIIFLVDIGVNFRTCYFDTSKCELESNIHRIREHYFYGWFGMDLLSSVPIEMISAISHSNNKNLAIIKTLRLLKLFRLVRLMHLNAIKDLEYKGYLPPSLVRLFKLVFVFLLITHLVACAYWAQARTADRWSTDHTSWLPLQEYDKAPLFRQYAEAFYWAMLVFVGADMNPTNTAETIFTSVMMLIGIGVFASVIGSASSLLTNLDSVAEMKKSQMDSINHYLTFHSVPKVLRNKIRDYYDYLWLSGQSIHDKNLFDQLPESLNLQLDLSLKRKLIEGVPMFKEISPLSVLAIIRKLSGTIAVPEEVIMRQGEQGDCMYFLMRGQADAYLELPAGAKHLTTMTDGAVFGEIALVHPEKPRTATVCALSYCEMQELKLPDFDELKQVYDDIAFHVMVTADRRLNRSTKKAKEATRERFDKTEARTDNIRGHAIAVDSQHGHTRPRDPPRSRDAEKQPKRKTPSPTQQSENVDGGKTLRGKLMSGLSVGSKKNVLENGSADASDIFNVMQQQSKKITRAQSRKTIITSPSAKSASMSGNSATAPAKSGSIKGNRVAPQGCASLDAPPQTVPNSASPAGDIDALASRRVSAPSSSGISGGDGHTNGMTPPTDKRSPATLAIPSFTGDLDKLEAGSRRA